MRRRADQYGPPARPVPPLGAALREALGVMPSKLAGDVAPWRARLFAEPGHLASVLRRIEERVEAELMPAASVAELWSWAAYLRLVCGRAENTTTARYVEVVAEYLAWCAGNAVDFRIATLQDLDAWQKWLFLSRRNGESWRTRKAAAVRNFYDWRRTRGLGENCAAGLRTSRDKPRMPRKYTVDQLRGLLRGTEESSTEAARRRDRAMMLLLLAAGLRRAELVDLNLEDLELGRKTAVIRVYGKGSREREISCEGPVVDALHTWIAARADLPQPIEPKALFVVLMAGDHYGRRLSVRTVEALVERCARSAGLRDWGVHRFRVTYATTLYDEGAEIEEIRILMGHESIETTRRYLAVSERARRTRVSSRSQHAALGDARGGQPRWVRAALGGAE